MTYEEMMKVLEDLKKDKEAYHQGKIDDGMSDECRKNWIERCNSQDNPCNMSLNKLGG